jgi:hypothetical protein
MPGETCRCRVTRRRVRISIAVTATPAVATALGAHPAQPPDDPIFAAIAAYHEESAAAQALSDQGYDDCHDDEEEAFRAVFETVPTTAAGSWRRSSS